MSFRIVGRNERVLLDGLVHHLDARDEKNNFLIACSSVGYDLDSEGLLVDDEPTCMVCLVKAWKTASSLERLAARLERV